MPCRDVLQDSVNGATRMRRPGPPRSEAKHLPIRGRRVVLHVRTSYVVTSTRGGHAASSRPRNFDDSLYPAWAWIRHGIQVKNDSKQNPFLRWRPVRVVYRHQIKPKSSYCNLETV